MPPEKKKHTKHLKPCLDSDAATLEQHSKFAQSLEEVFDVYLLLLVEDLEMR